jgi:hypothetical protein
VLKEIVAIQVSKVSKVFRVLREFKDQQEFRGELV